MTIGLAAAGSGEVLVREILSQGKAWSENDLVRETLVREILSQGKAWSENDLVRESSGQRNS